MAWSISKDPFTELSIQQTNMLANPIGMGVPVSGKEYNVNFLLRTQTEQGIFQSFCPSGIFTRLSSPALFETHTGTDVDGELVSLVASGIPVANTFRLGRQFALVNGWKIPISNADGSNGVHNNIVVDSAPLSGTRCDLVFLEVWIAQLGGTSATISNTANKPSATTIWKYGNTQYRGPNVTDDISEVDAEINRRWQLQYRIRVVDGVSVDTYTDGVDDTVNVKAWGANPNGTWTSMTAGTGSVYTFQNAFSTLDDAGLYVAGDGSSTAKSVLGTVDGYTYAIPICAISRRNQGVYDPSVNSFGCAAAGPTGGNIASGISGRPDGLYYDQIIVGDIVSLRHRIYTDSTTTYEGLASEVFEKLIRGGLRSKFSVGDGVGNPLTLRSTNPVYGQEISTIASIDPGFKGIAPFNYQRRIFSDDAVVQQTQFTFTGGFVPDNPLPSVLSTPVTPTGSATPGTGSLAAATYYFKVTYTNSYGETVASNESTGLVLSGTGKITINSPIVNGNASGWNVYITTVSGSETKQNSSPIAIGTNYVQSSALIAGSALPSSNTSSSTLVITADSDGITNGTVVVKCVDGTTTPSTGGLPGSVNITVYNANTFALVTGTWSGLGTATAVFTPTSIWGTNDTVYGVVAVVGLSYPAGNGLANLPTGVVGQTLIQGSNVTSMQTIGVSGVAAADDTHLNQPTGVAVDSSGNIYVADRGNHRVVKYDNTLVKQGQFGVTGVAGSDNTHLNYPQALVVDSVGNVYVTDTLNHRVVKLNASMAYASQFGVTGISGSDTAHLNNPLYLSFDVSQANLFIADSLNNRIVRITNALVYGATPISSLTYRPTGVCVGLSGSFPVIYTTQQHSIVQYTTTDGITFVVGLTFGVPATHKGDTFGCYYPYDIKLDSSGNVVFCDSYNARLVRLNSNFIYIGQLGVNDKTAQDLGHFNYLCGLAIDSSGLFCVADTNNHRILEMSREMASCDPVTRKIQVMYSGAPSDKLKIWYTYNPYQGVIGNQGNTLMSYTLRALTDMKAIVTTCGTGGRNTSVEDLLNGLLTRVPLPAAAFGTSPTGQTEWAQNGGPIALGSASAVSDFSAVLVPNSIAYGGSMSVFGPPDAIGNQAGPTLAGSLIKISQNTLSAGYPYRGVNTIQRYVDNLLVNGGWDSFGVSYGTITTSTDQITLGYFLAAASGGSAVLPLINGEIVLVVVSFRSVGQVAAIYGQTNIGTAVDIFKLTGRPLIRY